MKISKIKQIIKYLFFPWIVIRQTKNLFNDYVYYTDNLSKRNLKFLLRSQIKYQRKNKSQLRKIRKKIYKNYLINKNLVKITKINI